MRNSLLYANVRRERAFLIIHYIDAQEKNKLRASRFMRI